MGQFFGRQGGKRVEFNKYESNGEDIEQKEFLIQDPDGYLLRFTQEE